MLFTDESCFPCEGIFNAHNSHVWELDNPHATFIWGYQQWFAVNIWAGVVGSILIGPYILPQRLTAAKYAVFQWEVLPMLMENVLLAVRKNTWFKHDGAPAHFGEVARDHLTATFGGR